jgi:flagellar assembly protein FliH
MVMNATKFTFDTVFAAERDVETDAARGRRRRLLSESEIDALRADARAEGAKAGEVLALEAIAAGTQDAIDALDRAMSRMTQEKLSLREQAAAFAFIVARKLAHAALAAFPHADVEAALREAMHQAVGEPRIVLKAAPQVADALASRLAAIAQEEAYDGRVQVSADPALKRADCRIEWRGGGAERAESAIEAALEQLLKRNFQSAIGTTDDQGAVHGKQ